MKIGPLSFLTSSEFERRLYIEPDNPAVLEEFEFRKHNKERGYSANHGSVICCHPDTRISYPPSVLYPSSELLQQIPRQRPELRLV